MVFASHAFFASAALQMNPNILAFFNEKNINLCFKNKGILPPDKCSPQTGAQNLI